MLHMCFVHVQTSLITITKLRIHFSRTKSTDPIGSHWARPPKSALMFLSRILLKKRRCSPRRRPRGFLSAPVNRIRRTKFSHETKCCLEFLKNNSWILDLLYY